MYANNTAQKAENFNFENKSSITAEFLIMENDF